MFKNWLGNRFCRLLIILSLRSRFDFNYHMLMNNSNSPFFITRNGIEIMVEKIIDLCGLIVYLPLMYQALALDLYLVCL